MSDSTPVIADLLLTANAAGQAAKANDLFDASSPAMLWALNPATTTGLTFGLIGGRYKSASVSNQTVSLTASNDNYIVAAISDGTVSVSTGATNWNSQGNYIRLYKVVAGGSSITSYEDHRQAIGVAGGGNRAPTIQSVTSSATVTPTFDDDIVLITAQAAGLTLANPTGTPINGLGMVIRIKDDGTPRSIGYDTQYRAIGVTLPTTTVSGKTMYLAMIYNATDTNWDVLAVGEEA